MRRILALYLAVLIALGDFAFSQNIATPEAQSSAGSSSAPAKTQTTPAVAKAPAAPSALVSSGSPAPNMLLDGTPVKLRLAENLSSATSKTGQDVLFEVVEEVDVRGVPVIAKGASALGTVTFAQPKRRMGRGGKLDVNIDSVRLIDGEKAMLRAQQGGNAGGHVGAMTGAMVATGIVFFPAAPLFLFMHGKDINIPKGTVVTAFTQGDMKLDMAKFEPQTSSRAVATAASNVAASIVTVDANVPNCDIEVDGSFVGSTPSTLHLVLGKHQIAVKKPGYQDWTRSMMVDAGAIRLSADMVPVK